MAWRFDQPPRADANSMTYKEWVRQVWQFLMFGSNVVRVSADYEAKMEDKFILMNAAGGARVVLLPYAKGNLGKEIIIKKTEGSGNSVSAVPRGTETIDGAGSAATTSMSVIIRLVSDNTNWNLW